jgi:hypothetical protein
MSQGIWPWLALAAAGALHGLFPAAWAAVAGGQRAWHCLLPVAAGHVASVIVLAGGVPLMLWFSLDPDTLVPALIATATLVGLGVGHPCGRGALALWSFVVGSAHGSGWMVVPALLPLCASGVPGSEITVSGSVVLALAAVGVHLAAMLGTVAAVTGAARRVLVYGRDP